MSRMSVSLAVCVMVGVLVLPVRSQSPASPTIKKDTRAILVLRDLLTSRQSVVGDGFSGYLKEAIRVDGQVLLPAHIRFVGHVATVTPWQNGTTRSEIGLTLDSIVLPSGSVPVSLGFLAITGRDRDPRSIDYGSYGASRPGQPTGGSAGTGARRSSTGWGGNSSYGNQGYGYASTIPNPAPGADKVPSFSGGVVGVATSGCGDVHLSAGALLQVRFAEALTIPPGDIVASQGK